MEIRELKPEDLDAWVDLRQALWPDAQREALRAEATCIQTSPDEVCFVLVDTSRGVVGFLEGAVHPGTDHPYAHVEGWYVVPDLQKQGHGGDLLSTFETWCLHRSIRQLTSDTTDDYPISPRAHESCGFRVLMRQTIYIKELHQSEDPGA